jgi:hypothetical protein
MLDMYTTCRLKSTQSYFTSDRIDKVGRSSTALPFEAMQALKELGQNLRTARLRRNMTLQDVADRVGIHRETLALAEKGSPNVSIGNYVGALWVMGLANQVSALADPEGDRVGQSMESVRERARRPGGMSNDF